LGGEVAQAFPEHSIERRKRVDDVRERLEWDAEFDGQHELAEDLACPRSDQGSANQDAALAVGNQLERAPVKVVNVAADGLRRISAGDEDVRCLGRVRQTPRDRPTPLPDR